MACRGSECNFRSSISFSNIWSLALALLQGSATLTPVPYEERLGGPQKFLACYPDLNSGLCVDLAVTTVVCIDSVKPCVAVGAAIAVSL